MDSDIIRLLNDEENRKIVSELYSFIKEYLDKEFQDMDECVIESYIMAYLINVYESKPNSFVKKQFIASLDNKFILAELIRNFKEKLNGTKATLGDKVNKEVKQEIDELQNYRNSNIYKELSTSDKEIIRIIKEYHGYRTIKELKELASKEPPKGKYRPYIISLEEIKIMECVKECPTFNQLAHLLYDEKKGRRYVCDHRINGEEEKLKIMMANTSKNNPQFDIIFDDGTIIDYYRGDIRIKPYKFQNVIELVKLYYAKHFEEMKENYNSTMFITNLTNEQLSYLIGKQMVVSSFISVIQMLSAYEEVYTRKMIDDSKKEYVKIKETAEKYDL